MKKTENTKIFDGQTRLIILGAGGHGRIVADCAEALGYRDIVFYDDLWPARTQNLTWHIVGTELPRTIVGVSVFVAIGNNPLRLLKLRQLKIAGAVLPSLVHPMAHVSRHATLGIGTYVGPMSSVNVGATIGAGVIVNTGASVDHDCRLADGVHVSPGAHLAGGVHVGEASWIGIGASVREGLVIGSNVIVGAGAAVVLSVEDGEKVLGVPARSVS